MTKATMLEKRGTCPACMGEFQLYGTEVKPVVGKHGWREVGGRRVGVYGLAEHVGECFGVDWAPFELSPEGTWAFLNQVVYPRCLAHLSYLERLAARCDVFVTDKVDGKDTRVALTPTNEAGSKRVEVYRLGRYVSETRYEKVRESKIAETEGAYRQDFSVGQNLCRLALAWKLQDLKDGSPQGPTVHFKNEGARVPYCGSRSYGLSTTEVETDVTCSRCMKAIEADHKADAARAALEADAAALTEHLRSLGKPQTKSQIKKALGWDTKRVNRAVDQAERPWRDGKTQPGTIRRADGDWNKPEAFEVTA